jgi:hypothetical protein
MTLTKGGVSDKLANTSRQKSQLKNKTEKDWSEDAEEGPLAAAAERSGYLHPVFVDFIDIFVSRCTNSPPFASRKLQLHFSIAHGGRTLPSTKVGGRLIRLIKAPVKRLLAFAVLPFWKCNRHDLSDAV